jgi:hypothetical protein
VLLAHPRNPADAFAGRGDQSARHRAQDPYQDQGNQHDAREAQAVDQPKISRLEQV